QERRVVLLRRHAPRSGSRERSGFPAPESRPPRGGGGEGSYRGAAGTSPPRRRRRVERRSAATAHADLLTRGSATVRDLAPPAMPDSADAAEDAGLRLLRRGGARIGRSPPSPSRAWTRPGGGGSQGERRRTRVHHRGARRSDRHRGSRRNGGGTATLGAHGGTRISRPAIANAHCWSAAAAGLLVVPDRPGAARIDLTVKLRGWSTHTSAVPDSPSVASASAP